MFGLGFWEIIIILLAIIIFIKSYPSADSLLFLRFDKPVPAFFAAKIKITVISS